MQGLALTPEYCPFDQVEDTCGPMARLLEQAVPLTLTPNAPAHPGQESDADGSAFNVPAAEVSLWRIVVRINTWGRSALDATFPCLDVAPGDVTRRPGASPARATAPRCPHAQRCSGRQQGGGCMST